MRIGMIATRLGDVDGVSFEALKWQAVLEGLGHEVVRCAGALAPRHPFDRCFPEMHFTHPAAARVSSAAFDGASDAIAVRAEIDRLAGPLQQRLAEWAEAAAVDSLIVQNAWAIPIQLPLGVALARLVADSGLPAVGHHHDYWWERERFGTCVVPGVLERAFPPHLANISHVSINSVAADSLLRRRAIHSTVVPNVFDFDQPVPAAAAAGARRLRAEMNVPPGGVLAVQPTRVVPRKGIELAIELVARLGKPNTVLLITSPAGDEGHAYLADLKRLAERMAVDLRHEPQRFRPSDGATPDGPAHALADAYLAADLITYPSLYEGFGNALIEAIFFRRLTVVNRYPVFETDIRPLGFRFIELDGSVTDTAIELLRAALDDPAGRAADTEHNFNVARRHFGYDRLKRALGGLLDSR